MSYADNLVGQTLSGGWRVVEKLSKSSSGSNFSVGYKAVNTRGDTVFVKAMNYKKAFAAWRRAGIAVADIMKMLSQDFVFERDFCMRCKNLSLKRVAHAIEHGQIEFDPDDPIGSVDYLIFEMASGDVRKYLESRSKLDKVFALRSLHHMATGLFHMHGAGMAHQDLKPSNTLIFDEKGLKLCDFGRSWCKDIRSPYDDEDYPGDPDYGPPELMMNAVPHNVDSRRFGCDLYQLGSMVVFFFTGATIRGLLESFLTASTRAAGFGGTFEEQLPMYQAAFGEALDLFSSLVPDEFRDELVLLVRQLCDPDPTKRGHPDARKFNQSSAERYMSILDRMATKAEIRFRMGLD